MSREGTKGKHLTLEERINILNDLIKGEKLSDIATKIGKDPTTVSKEIKKHRYCNKRKFNLSQRSYCFFCSKQKDCSVRSLCKGQNCNLLCRNCKFKDPTKIKSFEVCEEGLLVEVYNPNNRYMYPIQLGITLLAISRYLMGSFIHEKLKPNIKNFKMLYTATDSIFATGDNYKEYLDTLPQNNKLGEFKIVEDNITEFIALQSKVYAYKTNDHVVTKGSAFSIEDYKQCLFEGIEKSNQYVRYDIKGNVNIRNKILLSNKWNNSRKLLEDGINTVSHH